VLIGLVLVLSIVPAGAHHSGGYQHHYLADSWNYSNPDWMVEIPDGRRLSELSIIETHDTMAKTGTGAEWKQHSETQSLDLVTQLESGIRSLDIRLQRKNGVLECWHGADYFEADFNDVLSTVVDFLEEYKSETILMRIAENSRPYFVEICTGICPIGDNPPFYMMVEEYLQRTYYDQDSNPIGPYSDWVWQPTSVNPTLGEVRGKIVILDNFSMVGKALAHVTFDEKLAEGGNSSLALDDIDYYPHISFYSSIWGSLNYVFEDSSGWHLTTVDSSANNVGKYSSLALDKNNRPHISYYDESNEDLKYAYMQTNGGWWFAPIDSVSGIDVGQYTSIALDDDDHPHISYYDAGNGDLKYAYGKNLIDDGQGWEWDISQVDEGWLGADVGRYSSLALDDGKPHISYYDSDNDDLMYAKKARDGYWLIGAVDTRVYKYSGDVGLYPSLALDSAGNPHVSYFHDIYWWLSVDPGEMAILYYADLENKVCGEGIPYITDYGLRVGPPCFMEKVYWKFDHPEEIYTKKWKLVKDQLKEADKGSRDRFYLNGLNGTGGSSFPYPWFIVSGHVNSTTDVERRQTSEVCTNGTPNIKDYRDFPCNDSGDKMLYEGTNELTLNYLNANPPEWLPKRWGIIVTDFPGADLIDAIISSNFPPLKAIFLPNILR
jgi:hypothetical protein